MVRRSIGFNSKGQTLLPVADHHDRKSNVERVFRNYNRAVPFSLAPNNIDHTFLRKLVSEDQMKRWYLYKPERYGGSNVGTYSIKRALRKRKGKGEIINSMCARGKSDLRETQKINISS
jgi:hypothetical protein